ncbi:MAG TPA: hypothetical protein DCR44_06165 [Acholeplasmatales bacterium]|nr:hypothetical protein [Acholeplasmatales bacterium]
MPRDFKKDEKSLYQPKDEPSVVTVGPQRFFCIKGRGNPNGPDFAERLGVLYALAYAVRMMPKSGFTPEGYEEYVVYPLEGLWDLSDEAKKDGIFRKDELVYTLMIRQPDFVNENVAARAFAAVAKKKPGELLKEAYFDTIEDGLSVQIMHHGPYDDEPASFARMNAFLDAAGYEKRTLVHREIYLSDARKTPPAKMRTILRYRIRKAV